MQGRYTRCHLWINTWSRSCYRPRAVVAGARHCRLSSRLQSATSTATSGLLTVCTRHIATKTFVQAFIFCRLDYSNSMRYDVNDGLLRRHESVHTAARLVTSARRSAPAAALASSPSASHFKGPLLVYQSLARLVTCCCYVIDTGLLQDNID